MKAPGAGKFDRLEDNVYLKTEARSYSEKITSTATFAKKRASFFL